MIAATPAPKPTTNIHLDVSRVVIADTSIMKVRSDTIKFVIFDTLRIVKTIKDTSIVIKIDTVKTSSKPVQVK